MSQTTHAGPVLVNEVFQTVNTLQNSVDLRLRNLSQDPVSPDVKVTGATSEHSSKGGPKTDSLLSGVAVDLHTPRVEVVVAEDAIVEGTVCDCGEIIVPGGFPKWPLLFLAAIPLIFINHDCDSCTVTRDRDCIVCDVVVTPTPTPTPNSTTPEPASLLLFGTGLLAFGAGLRRRYAKAKLTAEIKAKDE